MPERFATEDPPYRLPEIPHLRLRLLLRSLGHARLPPYKGSLLRGAFGHALRRLTCAMGPGQDCASCRLRHGCIHTRLFETFVEGEPPPFLGGLETAPRPYVLEPEGDRCSFPPGEALTFDLILLGQAIDLQAHALLAVETLAAAGLGRDRHPFALDGVSVAAPNGLWVDLSDRDQSQRARSAVPGPSGALPPAGPPLGGRAVIRFGRGSFPTGQNQEISRA